MAFRRPPGSSPGRAGEQQCACMEELCKEHPASLGSPGKGSAGELAVETRNEWCKVHIPLGSKSESFEAGPRAVHSPTAALPACAAGSSKVWSELSLSNCHHEELGQSTWNTGAFPSPWLLLARLGSSFPYDCLFLVVSKRQPEAVGFSHPL